MIYNTYAYTLLHDIADDRYVGLLTSAPVSITDISGETTYGDYARVQVLTAGWENVAGANRIRNVSSIQFAPRGASPAGTVMLTHFGIYDATSGGAWRSVFDLVTSVPIAVGDTPIFGANNLVLVVA